jgi:hypothetical protein
VAGEAGANYNGLEKRVGMLEQNAAVTSISLQYISASMARIESAVNQNSIDLNNWTKVQMNDAKVQRDEQRTAVKDTATELRAEAKTERDEQRVAMKAAVNGAQSDCDEKMRTADGAGCKRLDDAMAAQSNRLTLWVATAATISVVIGIVIGFFIP